MRFIFVFPALAFLFLGISFASENDVTASNSSIPITQLSHDDGPCRIEVSPDAKVVAYGAYEGGLPSDHSLEYDSGHETRQIEVHPVPEQNRVFLVLTAYDPVIWVLTPDLIPQIDGVLVMGHHRQAIANLPEGKNIDIVTYKDRELSNCGDEAYAYKGGTRLERLDKRVLELTGRNIEKFSGLYRPKSFPLKSGSSGAKISTLLVQGEKPKMMDISAGPAGVRELVKQGVLRPAQSEDIKNWLAAATKRSSTGHLAPVSPSEIQPHELYVATRSFKVPPGLYGGNSISVIVTSGVEIDDRGSHNTYYSLETGEKCMPGRACSIVQRSR